MLQHRSTAGERNSLKSNWQLLHHRACSMPYFSPFRRAALCSVRRRRRSSLLDCWQKFLVHHLLMHIQFLWGIRNVDMKNYFWTYFVISRSRHILAHIWLLLNFPSCHDAFRFWPKHCLPSSRNKTVGIFSLPAIFIVKDFIRHLQRWASFHKKRIFWWNCSLRGSSTVCHLLANTAPHIDTVACSQIEWYDFLPIQIFLREWWLPSFLDRL